MLKKLCTKSTLVKKGKEDERVLRCMTLLKHSHKAGPKVEEKLLKKCRTKSKFAQKKERRRRGGYVA